MWRILCQPQRAERRETSEVVTSFVQERGGARTAVKGRRGEQPLSGPVLTQAGRLLASWGPRQEGQKSGKGPSVPCQAGGGLTLNSGTDQMLLLPTRMLLGQMHRGHKEP